MNDENRLIWFKGKILPANEALVSVLSPTAQFGLNVFEGIRGYWNNDYKELYLFRLEEHIKRLHASCRLIGLACPYSDDEIKNAIISVLHENNYKCDIALRINIFVDGEGTWSDSKPVEMFIAPIDKPRSSIESAKGVKANISSWERINDRSLPPRVKAGANYINGRYAHLESIEAGYDLPIFLDSRGKVSEGAGSCIMMVRNGKLITPPVTASILESITRETLLILASELGLLTEVRTIDRTELYLADELFLCGSAAEVTPIIKLDRFSIGLGKIGELTQILMHNYHLIADGSKKNNNNWLTSVWNDK